MCMFGLIQKQHAWSGGVCNVYVWSEFRNNALGQKECVMCMFGLIQKQRTRSEGVCNMYVWSDSETTRLVRRSV